MTLPDAQAALLDHFGIRMYETLSHAPAGGPQKHLHVWVTGDNVDEVQLWADSLSERIDVEIFHNDPPPF